MIYHVLNGDSLGGTFPSANINGEIIVMRECLIEGDVHGETLADFITTRARFIAGAYREDEKRYHEEVGREFEKLVAAPGNSEFNLWFEYDLFCQANMWFILSLIYNLPIQKQVYVVYPTYLKNSGKGLWSGFGPATTTDLLSSYNDRTRFTDNDLRLGRDLWLAYKNNKLDQLKKLSHISSPCFPYLREVVQAHIERFPSAGRKGRPERVLEDIIKSGTTDFNAVVLKFWEKESIYGFGDVQVKHLYDKVMEEQ